MTVEVRVCRPEEVRAAFTPIWHYFGRDVTDEEVTRFGRILPPERLHAAFVDGAAVGGTGAYAFDLTVPGGRVPAAGVMGVGVLPTHRRQGVLNALMRRQLDDLHERGEPLALLYASEGAIYGRYGYGIASLAGDIRLTRARAALHPVAEAAAQARLVSHEDALDLFPAVYDEVRADTPGMFARSRAWWEIRRLTARRDAAGELARVLVEASGRPEAYAIYRIDFSIEQGMSTSTVHVTEALGTTPRGTRAIWNLLLSLDWVETIRASFLPLDHPLFFLLVEPRRMHFTVGEALWARLLDVGSALSARSYTGDGPIVFAIADSFCPWNEGRWRLEGGMAGRTEDEPDLALDVADLGSAYLGGFTFAQLAAAGRVDELRPGALARADELFRPDRAPWCPEIF
jgi:predicted acetyltransferase